MKDVIGINWIPPNPYNYSVIIPINGRFLKKGRNLACCIVLSIVNIKRHGINIQCPGNYIGVWCVNLSICLFILFIGNQMLMKETETLFIL